jgi:hypothetical protein
VKGPHTGAQITGPNIEDGRSNGFDRLSTPSRFQYVFPMATGDRKPDVFPWQSAYICTYPSRYLGTQKFQVLWYVAMSLTVTIRMYPYYAPR